MCCLAYVCLYLCQSINIIKTTPPKKQPTLYDLSPFFRSPFGLALARSFSRRALSLSFVYSSSLLCSLFSCPSPFSSHSWRYLCITRRTFNIHYMCLKYKARLFYSHQFSTVYTPLRLYVVTLCALSIYYLLHLHTHTCITYSYVYSSFWLCTKLESTSHRRKK